MFGFFLEGANALARAKGYERSLKADEGCRVELVACQDLSWAFPSLGTS